MTEELKALYDVMQRNKDNAQNSIRRCRDRIIEIEKEMSYYEGQRDEADLILSDIEKLIKGVFPPTPCCNGDDCCNAEGKIS
ncbi:MAG: hypothetical protein PHH48_07825 [Eubacteriales bacterium]|nr:hypothetical protein [Eubacteriales bacterium]